MRDPDKRGPRGEAWEIRRRIDPSHERALRQYLVNCPAGALWCFGLVSVVALRSVSGCPEPFRDYPEAEFELLVAGVDQDACPLPDPERDAGALTIRLDTQVPLQFHGVRDKDAALICGMAVDMVLTGQLSTGLDFWPTVSRYRKEWREWLDCAVARLQRGEI